MHRDTMSELYLVRHAQASFDAACYDDLSTTGIAQSQRLGRYFAAEEIVFDGIVGGEMQRHRQTIDVVREASGSDVAQVQTHNGLNEYDFRAMMRRFAELNPDDELVAAIAADPTNRKAYFRLLRRVLTAWSKDHLDEIPETWTSFQTRVKEARRVLQNLTETCKRLLVVSSGGAISTLLGSVLELRAETIFEVNLQILNTSITRFFISPSTISLAEFNATPHLAVRRHADLRTYS